MSNTCSPSRSSPILTGQPKAILIPRLPHPPRLQHSPSLPNIWFPQSSDPIIGEKEKGARDSMHRPSAPSSPKSKPPASVAVKEPQMRHVKYASIDPVYRKPQGAKTHTRRRTERDEPHSLLTPPLTPSSSIRTTASSDSAASAGVQTNQESNENPSEEILDSDTESTRILLFENVSQNITVASLESAIGDAFANVAAEKNTGEVTSSSAPREVLKGINLRLHRDEGIVPIVFFDVREAKRARDLVETKQFDGYLKKCIGDSDGEETSTGLSARLITLEELFKIIGHSRFLDGIDGAFSLKVQKLHHKDSDDVRTPTERDTPLGTEHQEGIKTKHAQGLPVTRGGINSAILQSVLKSYGSIRFFKFIREEVDEHGVTSIVYQVEYHDLRDADTSCRELNDQKMFGMQITITGGNKDIELEPQQQGDSEPFPNTSTAGETFIGLPIRPAGAHSHIRQPFIYTVAGEDTPHEQATTDPVSQTVSLPNNPPSGGELSPTYFYTTSTTPFDLPNQNVQLVRHDQVPVHVRGLGFPDGRHTSAMAAAHRELAQEQQWENDAVYRSDCISPCYGHDGVCHYCPSRGIPHNMAYNPPFPGQYAFPLPPLPTPPVYYPGHIPPPTMITNMINVVPAPSPNSILGYEYVDRQMQPAPHTGAWGYDPAIAAVGPGVNTPSPAPFFLREEALPTHARGLHPIAYTHFPSASHVNQNQPPMSPSSHSAPLMSTESTPATLQPGGSTHDHNQLNLERIISGMDTRTTVMIKNIPNKMSDSDLEVYIGKVCPHRIDFLYLRMDFKNGCNVGYAFVNFIHVEDLLHFARERLGAKWNMFSSEKVLQMSYANYQGKEALVEKFKNSAIMDERESWRPRIFFSAGPNAGYPEPFPAPTHIRRKERSSYNKGTLFPPGINSHSMASHSYNNVQSTARRYHQDDAPRVIPQRGVGGPRYQAHAHNREQDDGGEVRRSDRMLTFRATSNQRAAR